MKFLFDQNLSHRLVQTLEDVYPDCQHVRNVGLKEAPDTRVWDFARNEGYTVVSKDADFHQRSLLLGFPPKVIWVRLGNCSTQDVEHVLRHHLEEVEQFEVNVAATFLILS
jgi:predicted nuclease of predicted toxin-antitoxin system